MKLTGTNSSIGLIIHIARTHPTKSDGWFSLTRRIAFLRNAGAPRGRRISADARSCLRASPEARANQDRGKTRCNEDVRHILPYSLIPLLPSNPSFSTFMPFADLVVLAGWLHPFPFRTRP